MYARNRLGSWLSLRLSGRLGVAALLSLMVLTTIPSVVSAASLAARASLTPTIEYLGDSAGTVFKLAVRNTGSTYNIAAVRIKRPYSAWTVTGCPSAPAGWTSTSDASRCTYRSGAAASDDIHPGETRYFSLRATTLPGTENRFGTWTVLVSRVSGFALPAKVVEASSMSPGLRTQVYTFEVTSAIVSSAPQTPGAPCPAASKTAAAGSTGLYVVICGRNHATTARTPKAAYSTLGGTFIASHGGFASGPVAPSTTRRVLGTWHNVQVTSTVGSGFSIKARIGASSSRTSPKKTIAGYSTTAPVPTDVHDVSFTKACTSPVNVGDPYTCSMQVLNDVDTVHDTLQISGLSDSVHAASGDVSTGNILSSVGLVFGGAAGAVSCSGGSGAGTLASPYQGATACQLQFGGTISTTDFSHYTVQGGDYDLALHRLPDTATLDWNNTCATPGDNCTTLPQTSTAASSALVDRLSSSTTTAIHDVAHQTVTTVEAGTTVHDFITVTGQPSRPLPSGNVTVDFFMNQTCSGSPAANSGNVALDGSGQADAVLFARGPLAGGFSAFQATYAGDGTYAGSTGACEALRVVDANIQLAPATADVPAGTNHVLTCLMTVNDGTGAASAPAGAACTASIQSGPGSFVGSNQCTAVGTTGTCTLTITSLPTGTTTIRATTIVSVAGVTLTRTTGDTHAGDGSDAQVTWGP
jgi:hypothetical protein